MLPLDVTSTWFSPKYSGPARAVFGGGGRSWPAWRLASISSLMRCRICRRAEQGLHAAGHVKSMQVSSIVVLQDLQIPRAVLQSTQHACRLSGITNGHVLQCAQITRASETSAKGHMAHGQVLDMCMVKVMLPGSISKCTARCACTQGWHVC